MYIHIFIILPLSMSVSWLWYTSLILSWLSFSREFLRNVCSSELFRRSVQEIHLVYFWNVIPLVFEVGSRLSPLVRSLSNGDIHVDRVLSSSSAPLALFLRIGCNSIRSVSRSLFLDLRSRTSCRNIFSRFLPQQLHIAAIRIVNADA